MSQSLYRSLKAAFSAAILGGLAVPMQAAAQESGAPPPEASAPEFPPTGRTLPPDRRRVEEKTDDFFAQKFKVYATRESIFIGQPYRYDFPLVNLPEDGPLTVTRQYIEFRPMEKEWYGHATGVGYGIDLDIGNGLRIGREEWFLRGGLYLGNFESPDRFERRDNRDNNVANAFIEGSRSVTFGQKTPANLILGVSFNRATGPDVERPGSEARFYQQIDFPRLFGSQLSGESDIGRFSGMVKTHVGTRSYGATAGIYLNDLKPEGGAINYSIGPEVRYDNEEGVSLRLRVRVAPKFW